MNAQLYVTGAGAVTPVGLNAPQTCAGIRARLSRFEEVLRSKPFGEPQVVARIPVHWSLRSSPTKWLVNLGARALKEVVERHRVSPAGTALIVIPPERFRFSAFADPEAIGQLADSISSKANLRFSSVWQVEGGAASIAAALAVALRCLNERNVSQVIVGGVDTYVLEDEYTRLDAAGRLRREGTAQGLTPGEGATFLLLSRERPVDGATSAAILGWGNATEQFFAGSESYSQGRGMVSALQGAVAGSGTKESVVDWAISNANGERYASWESILARARFYRTHRERLPTVYPAMSVGETGSASGALALLVAAHGFSRGYAPGRAAMIELSSEGHGRAACLMTAASVDSH